jgi:hypothetical protein
MSRIILPFSYFFFDMTDDEIRGEITRLQKMMRARALRRAIAWAGSPRALAQIMGLRPATANHWVRRGEMPPGAACMLTRPRAFGESGAYTQLCPVKFDDLCCGLPVGLWRTRRCEWCHKPSMPPNMRLAGLRLIKESRSRIDKALGIRAANIIAESRAKYKDKYALKITD